MKSWRRISTKSDTNPRKSIPYLSHEMEPQDFFVVVFPANEFHSRRDFALRHRVIHGREFRRICLDAIFAVCSHRLFLSHWNKNRRGTSDTTTSSSLIVSLIVMSFDEFLHSKTAFENGRTDGLTDTTSYRDTYSNLKRNQLHDKCCLERSLVRSYRFSICEHTSVGQFVRPSHTSCATLRVRNSKYEQKIMIKKQVRVHLMSQN